MSEIANGEGGASVRAKLNAALATLDAHETRLDELGSTVVRLVRLGVRGDGSDDTDALRAAHEAANAVGLPVSYAGLRRVALRPDAQIVINTSVDFAGVIVEVIGGLVDVPSFPRIEAAEPTSHWLFRVYDATTPVLTGNVVPVPANLLAGSVTPTRDFFRGPGFALLQAADSSGPRIANRAKDGLLPYRQAFAVNRDGLACEPLSVDASTIAVLGTRTRAAPALGGRITLKGLRADATTFNNQVLLRVERNFVTIADLMVLPETGATPAGSINELIQIRDAAFIDIERVDASAQTTIANQGTYLLHAVNAAEIRLDRVTALGGWGMMATKDVNGFHVSRSVVNRVDCHDGGHNITVRDSTLHEHGVTFGWGGGRLSILGCRLVNCPAVTARPDYGGYWFGSIEVRAIDVVDEDFTSVLVDLGGTTPVGVPAVGAFPGLAVPMPSAIVIDGVTRLSGDDNLGGAEILPLHMAVAAGATVYAPQSIAIADLRCAGDWRLQVILDLQNLRHDPVDTDRCRVSLSQCHPSYLPVSETGGLFIRPNTIAGAGVRTAVRIANCSGLVIDARQASPDVEFWISDTALAMFRTASGLNAEIQGGVLDVPLLLAGEAASPLGGARGAGRYLAVKNVRVRGAWDLSAAASLIGVDIPPLASNAAVVLPAGVTPAQAFTGWQVPSF